MNPAQLAYAAGRAAMTLFSLLKFVVTATPGAVRRLRDAIDDARARRAA